MCVPDDDESQAGTQLLRSQPSVRRMQSADGSVQFHPSHGQWLTLLRASGFELDRLEELYAPPGSVDHPFYKLATADWAQRWPVEELWVAHKR
jgi:hypothetical protein